jgi:hypothetical protein
LELFPPVFKRGYIYYYMKQFIITEEERSSIRGMYLLEQETTEGVTGETMTSDKLLQGKEFPGLTKQVDDDRVYYSLFKPDGRGRKFWLEFRVSPVGSFNTTVAAGDPSYFGMAESLYNSLNSFQSYSKYSSQPFDKSDPEMVYGVKGTKLDPQEITQILDTLLKTYNSIPKQ